MNGIGSTADLPPGGSGTPRLFVKSGQPSKDGRKPTTAITGRRLSYSGLAHAIL